MIVSAIAAMDENNLIGIGLKMPWHMPTDFKFFKATTLNHPIIFGRKSFEAIGSRPLPNRQHIIVSTNPELNYDYDNVFTVTSIEDAIALAMTMEGNDEVFICGGGIIYRQVIERRLVDRLYITKIHTEIPLKKKDDPIYFPKINDDWDMMSIRSVDADDKNEYNMTFLTFERN